MGKKPRRSEVPKAPVIAQRPAAGGKKQPAPKPRAKGRGTYLSIGGDDSDEDDDIAPAKAFAQADVDDGDDALEEDEEGEDEDSDLQSVSSIDALDDADGSGDDEDDEGDSDGFEAKAERFKAKMDAEQAENLAESAAAARKRKAAVFRARAGEDDGLDEEGEEDEEPAGDAAGEAAAEAALTIQQRKDRIQEVMRALDNFKEQREGDHSRREYLAIFLEDLKQVYDYGDWLLRRLSDLFTPRELFEFLEANEKQRPLTVRTNTIKTTRRDLAQALTTRGMSVQPVGQWSKIGLQIFSSDVAVGSTAEYLAGQYIVQSASSFLPVMALQAEEKMRVLDMAAAPGGKTTHLAQQMKNSGTLFANDVSAERILALRGNLLRMGITNCIVTNYNGVGLEKVMRGFDRVLLDAPCTGVGVISRDPRIKQSKGERDVAICTQLQKKLLLSAVDSCKTGGCIVYSTCSILVEENEAAVDYVLKYRKVRVVETGLPFGRPGFTKYRNHRFHPTVELSRRYYPHIHNMDGFYVCRLEKLGDGPNTSSKWHKEPQKPAAPVHVPREERPVPEPPEKVRLRKKAAAEAAAAAAAAEAAAAPAGGGKRPRPAPAAQPGKKKQRPVVAQTPASFKLAAEEEAAEPPAAPKAIPIVVVDAKARRNRKRRKDKMRKGIAAYRFKQREKRRAAAAAAPAAPPAAAPAPAAAAPPAAAGARKRKRSAAPREAAPAAPKPAAPAPAPAPAPAAPAARRKIKRPAAAAPASAQPPAPAPAAAAPAPPPQAKPVKRRRKA